MTSRQGTTPGLTAAQVLSAWNAKELSRIPDKPVLFFEVDDLRSAITAIGTEKIVHSENAWAVLHDSEGHNLLLLQRST